MAKIICALAGTGKTEAAKLNRWQIRDSDSDEFRWLSRERRAKDQNPSWPQNFIEHAVEEFVKDDFDAILMSAYVEYLPMIAAQVPLIYVYPSLDMKDEFEMRYRARDPKWLADLLISRFDEWVTSLMAMEGQHLVLKPGQYLSDVLPEILTRP